MCSHVCVGRCSNVVVSSRTVSLYSSGSEVSLSTASPGRVLRVSHHPRNLHTLTVVQ